MGHHAGQSIKAGRDSGKRDGGLTFVEAVVSLGILALVLGGLIRIYVYHSELIQMSRGMTIALSASQAKIEEIRNHNYGLILADYASGGTPGDTFVPAGVPGSGLVILDGTNPDLIRIEVVVTWQAPSGRIMGAGTPLATMIARR